MNKKWVYTNSGVLNTMVCLDVDKNNFKWVNLQF